MLMIREHLARVASGKVIDNGDGSYRCIPCAAPLKDEVRRRSLWTYPMSGGFGKVANVRHLFCPSCQSESAGTNEQYAEPVYTMQLIDVNEDLMPTGFMEELRPQLTTL